MKLRSFKEGDRRIGDYEEFFKRLESERFNVYEKWRELQFKDVVPRIKPVANRHADGTWRRSYQKLPQEEYGQTNFTSKVHYETLYDAMVGGYNELKELKDNYQQQREYEKKQKEEEIYLLRLKNMSTDELIELVLDKDREIGEVTTLLKQSKKHNRQLKQRIDEAEALAEIVTAGLYKEYLECPVCGGEMRKMYSPKTGEYFVGCSDYHLDPKAHKRATKPFDAIARALVKQKLLY